jgi:hypothetical protein
MKKLAIPLVCFTGIISAFGALIHFAAIAGGSDWYVFFNAPPQVVASSRAGTWLAPVSTGIIGLLMAVCAAYTFSALGRLPRLPLPRLMLGGMAGVCLLRALVIVPLAINHPQLRNTFELVSGVIWGLAGAGFLVACLTLVRRPPAAGAHAAQNDHLKIPKLT